MFQWTYTKYRHTSKHSPKNLQADYTSPSNNYQDNDTLMLFNNNRNDNQFNINNNDQYNNNNDNQFNNDSANEHRQFQGNNNNLPRRRSNMKTVVCQYPECGKTFCHSCHLYRHQRLKHGHRFGVVAQTSFACQHPKCGKVFYRRSSLINHCLHVHSSTPSFHPPPSQFSENPSDVDHLLADCHHNNGGHDDDDEYNDGNDDMNMAIHNEDDGACGSDVYISDNKDDLKEQLFNGWIFTFSFYYLMFMLFFHWYLIYIYNYLYYFIYILNFLILYLFFLNILFSIYILKVKSKKILNVKNCLKVKKRSFYVWSSIRSIK